MIDPFTLLTVCAFATTFALATGIQIGFAIGRAVQKNAGGTSK